MNKAISIKSPSSSNIIIVDCNLLQVSFDLPDSSVIDKIPSREPAKDEEGNYIFSSKPGAPGERGGELLVRFQAVSRTQQCMAYQYITVNSRTRLSVIRRHITKYFKNLYERGFIFLSKTKEILKSNEKNMTVFDILPKVPQIQSKSMPNENFLFQDVQYKRVCELCW